MSGMTGREVMTELLAAMSDVNLRRLRHVAERRCMERPDDDKSANLHAMIVAEERQRRERAERRAA